MLKISSLSAHRRAAVNVSIAAVAILGSVFGSRASAQTTPDYLNYYEELGPYCRGTGGVTAGDPVDVATGALEVSETLGVLPGRLPFTLGWGFVSQDASYGPLGRGT